MSISFKNNCLHILIVIVLRSVTADGERLIRWLTKKRRKKFVNYHSDKYYVVVE